MKKNNHSQENPNSEVQARGFKRKEKLPHGNMNNGKSPSGFSTDAPANTPEGNTVASTHLELNSGKEPEDKVSEHLSKKSSSGSETLSDKISWLHEGFGMGCSWMISKKDNYCDDKEPPEDDEECWFNKKDVQDFIRKLERKAFYVKVNGENKEVVFVDDIHEEAGDLI